MQKRIDIDEVKSFITAQSAETKIYIGGDSERVHLKEGWLIDYTLAIVVHIDGKHGCKIFGEVQREPDLQWDKKSRPRMRLMQEVYKIAELYLQLADVLEEPIPRGVTDRAAAPIRNRYRLSRRWEPRKLTRGSTHARNAPQRRHHADRDVQHPARRSFARDDCRHRAVVAGYRNSRSHVTPLAPSKSTRPALRLRRSQPCP